MKLITVKASVILRQIDCLTSFAQRCYRQYGIKTGFSLRKLNY
ncbi:MULTISPECIES: hypothetical protein [Sporomusa]|nr:hypothetical protein [Sporomusa sphaeroides]HML33791.1 hypothetical protein [Sporomusa sphaeroides]